MSVWKAYNAPDKYIAPSGETWLRRTFERQIAWELTGKRHHKALAEILQVPVSLLEANDVIIRIEARRNASSGPFRDRRRVLKGA